MKRHFGKALAAVLACLMAAAPLAACGENSGSGSSSETPKDLWTAYWENDDAYGMTVKDGTLLLNGSPYYGFGFNYYSLFIQTYSAGSTEYNLDLAKAGIDQLAEYDTQVIRINVGGYGATTINNDNGYDWIAHYQGDSENFLNALSDVVDYCAEKRIGVIPSLFWKIPSVPAHFGETCSELGNTSSKSHAFIRSYTTAVVNKLKDSKAIMGWEISNEWNLETDLDTVAPGIDPFRVMTEKDYVTCAKAFDEIVTAADTHKRFISSGNAVQRTTQYNQSLKRAQADTWEEHVKAMEAFHPGNFNMVSDHVYDYPNQRDYRMTLDEYLSKSMAAAKQMGKVYFLGEWCLNITGEYPVWDLENNCNSSQMMTLEWTMEHMEDACNTIIDNRVQLTLFWNFDPADVTEGSFNLTNPQGSSQGKRRQKFGKFLFELTQKLNKESYPAALAKDAK